MAVGVPKRDWHSCQLKFGEFDGVVYTDGKMLPPPSEEPKINRFWTFGPPVRERTLVRVSGSASYFALGPEAAW